MDTYEKLTTLHNCTWTMPININDWYIKGTFQNDADENVYFEIPGVFNEEMPDENAMLERLLGFIEMQNRILVNKIHSGK